MSALRTTTAVWIARTHNVVKVRILAKCLSNVDGWNGWNGRRFANVCA